MEHDETSHENTVQDLRMNLLQSEDNVREKYSGYFLVGLEFIFLIGYDF